MDSKVFTTEQIAKLLLLKPWRVVRFAEVKDFGITPHYGVPDGPGSRRLYDIENLCEIALAAWLLEAGLQVKAIGQVLAQLRRQGGLSHFVTSYKHGETYLGIIRYPGGKKVSQDAVYLHEWKQLSKIFAHALHTSVLVIPIGLNFGMLHSFLDHKLGD